MELPPGYLAKKALAALHGSGNRWWCAGRFFAGHLDLHPQVSAALLTLQRAAAHSGVPSAPCQAAVAQAASWLALDHTFGPDGLRVRPDDDPRVLAAFLAADADGHGWVRPSRLGAAAHALRVAARAALLRKVPVTRRDQPGLTEADLEVPSAPAWQRWRGRLSPADLNLLEVFRACAASTPSRRRTAPPCGCAVEHGASMRHYVVACPSVSDHRRAALRAAGLTEQWLAAQPASTTKSGWVGMSAADTPAARVSAAIAVAEIALAVMRKWPPPPVAEARA